MGDLDINSNLEHLGCISKSPGGIGPLGGEMFAVELEQKSLIYLI